MARPAITFEMVFCAAIPTMMPMILTLAKRATESERSWGVEEIIGYHTCCVDQRDYEPFQRKVFGCAHIEPRRCLLEISLEKPFGKLRYDNRGRAQEQNSNQDAKWRAGIQEIM